MEKIILSVVIPMYNTGSRINQCLNSIINQLTDINEIEILIIDDGSLDICTDIAYSISEENEKIHYFRKNNEGVSSARNYGIDIAKGKYIYFLDSDDELDSKFFYNIKDLIKTEFELACFSFSKISEDRIERKISLREDAFSFCNGEAMKEFLFGGLEKVINGTVSNKIYNLEILNANKILFSENRTMSEDWMFNAEYLANIKYIETFDINSFKYIQNSESTLHTYNKNYSQDIYNFTSDISSLLLKYKLQCDDKSLFVFYLKRWFGLLYNESRNSNYADGKEKVYRYLSNEVFRVNFRYSNVSDESLKLKLYFLLIKMGFSQLIYTVLYLNNKLFK